MFSKYAHCFEETGVGFGLFLSENHFERCYDEVEDKVLKTRDLQDVGITVIVPGDLPHIIFYVAVIFAFWESLEMMKTECLLIVRTNR